MQSQRSLASIQQHPGSKVGLSKIAKLGPKECVLAGATGTHSVCVCTIHKNVKLMMEGTIAGLLTINAKDVYNIL